MRALLAAVGLALVSRASAEAQSTVGAYYYPWWGDGMSPTVGHTWDQTLRAHMQPQDHAPAAGYTSSANPATIAAHIEQSLRANISMWSLSWWGPTSREDQIIRNAILPHADAGKLKYTIHYETQGRFGSFDNPDFSQLQNDFRHLANHVFNDLYYMRIDGRPVVFMYLTRVYLDKPEGRQAIQDLRTMMQNEFGYDPYIVGDDVFSPTINTTRAQALDAITTYDVYAASGIRGNGGNATQAQVAQLEQLYGNMEDAAEQLGIDYIPAVSPGFNDKGVRDGNPAAARYLQGLGPETMGSLMSALFEDAAMLHADASIQNLIMVNSFNEWHEDTQIEATVTRPATNTDDSPAGDALTEGKFYEGYGTRYLDLLRRLSSGDVIWDGSEGADANNARNWHTGFAPRYGDRAVFHDAGEINLAPNSTWGSIVFNGTDGTVLNGTGTLDLMADPDTLAIHSADAGGASEVYAAITTEGIVRADHGHDLTFHQSVTAQKIEAFNGAVLHFDSAVTATGTGSSAFISGNATSHIVFAGGFTTTHTGEFGLNGGGAVYASAFATPNSASHVVNLFNGKHVGSLADFAFQGNNLWARTNDGVAFDLNGFSDSLEFLGTNHGVVFTIDFGATGGANHLEWLASHHMNGSYAIINFEIGVDTLRLGSMGSPFFTGADLSRIVINGIGYSAEPLTTSYWDRDANGYVHFYNVSETPEPATFLTLIVGSALTSSRGYGRDR